MIHSFDTDVATKYGVNAAILLYNIHYWVEKNEANEKHFYDGRYWTYNSVKAFSALFPYMTSKVIRATLKKLEDSGLILVGSYNEQPFDRTKWYAVTARGEAVLPQKEPKDDIPHKEIVDYLNEVCGTRFKHTSSATRRLITARYNDGFTIEDFRKVIDNRNGVWGGDPKMSQYLRPETLFGTKFEGYLNSAREVSAYKELK